jgi:hypothetical protein
MNGIILRENKKKEDHSGIVDLGRKIILNWVFGPLFYDPVCS